MRWDFRLLFAGLALICASRVFRDTDIAYSLDLDWLINNGIISAFGVGLILVASYRLVTRRFYD